LGRRVSLAGLLLYVIFAPHSIAASAIGVALAGIGWVMRIVATGTLGLRRSKFDLIILLSLLWTIASSALSEEPRISLIKLGSSWSVFLFYLTRAVTTKRSALLLVVVLILSGTAGVIYSSYDLLRGRGVVVESLSQNSPLHQVDVHPGDTIWRIGGRRVYSVAEIDQMMKLASANVPLAVSLISQGEHVERKLVLSSGFQQSSSPSGVAGSERSHHFRASGWTRHYETFAELLQMIALLSLGLALANLRNHGLNKYFKLALLGGVVLTLGITFTAMRTVLVAFVIGASVMAWRSLRGVAKITFVSALFFVLAFGAIVVWQTRARNAVVLADPSSSLRAQVAGVGLSRIMIHPVFGHGMDAMKRHWNEWGFPGKDMLHLHSTPLQLAFDRGLPMLVLWLWMMILFWLWLAQSENQARDLSDTNSSGVLLGALGSLTGFLASSMVNYNYGDGEVTMMFWWLMGIAMVVSQQSSIIGVKEKEGGRRRGQGQFT
jgi:O-Antigen ligase